MNSLDDLVFTVHGPTTAEDQLETVGRLYRGAFEKPPAEMEQGVQWLTDAWPRRITTPGFRLVIASYDGSAVGAVYGHQIRDTWWKSAVGIPAEVTKEWAGRTVATIDMMVSPDWQRRGVAQRMHGPVACGPIRGTSHATGQPHQHQGPCGVRQVGLRESGID